MQLIEMMRNRRSVRTYAPGEIPQEKLDLILEAGMLSASGKAIRPWEFIVVCSPETLRAMTQCRAAGANMLEGAAAAVVVLGDSDKSDVWVEDCSVAMANMHLMADSLGIGSCWIQGRLREAADGRTAEDYLRELLKFPEHYKLEAILSLGMPLNHPAPHHIGEMPEGKVHRETF